MPLNLINTKGKPFMKTIKKPASFQDVILGLQNFWAAQGCALLQTYDMQMGAGTYHPATAFRVLGDKPWKAAYVQQSRRPTDGRYGENPNRLQMHHQFQVVVKPSPEDSQELYLESLKHIGIDTTIHDIRFVEDDWESPTLGASGLGWEIWCDGMEISQYTYFQQMGGMECKPVTLELTYGLERLSMYILNVDNVYDLPYNNAGLTYGDIYKNNEIQMSAYNFEHADPKRLFLLFNEYEKACSELVGKHLPIPAYEQCIFAANIFNSLDARGVIGPQERQAYIARVRSLSKSCCQSWINNKL